MATLQINHSCDIRAEKTCTNFKWYLQDWSLLGAWYLKNKVESPEFVLSNGVKCKLMLSRFENAERGFRERFLDRFFFNIKFANPKSVHVFGTKIIVSLVDGETTKLACSKDISYVNIPATVNDIALELKNGDIQKHLIGDTLMVHCEIITANGIKRSIDFEDVNFKFSSEIAFSCFYGIDNRNGEFDVKFILGHRHIFAHRNVLAACSDVFSAMFNTDMQEKRTGSVDIQETKFDVFEAFLNYIYTGRVKGTKSVVEDLCVLGDKYQVEGLKTFCKLILSSRN